MAKLLGGASRSILEGPICNGSLVIGWHVYESSMRLRRFHAEISGFAFNSTILWDPERWRRRTLEPVRQLDTVRDGLQVSFYSCSFILKPVGNCTALRIRNDKKVDQIFHNFHICST